MKLKKLNAALGLLSIAALLVHIGYTVVAYLMYYYNPTLKVLTAVLGDATGGIDARPDKKYQVADSQLSR